MGEKERRRREREKKKKKNGKRFNRFRSSLFLSLEGRRLARVFEVEMKGRGEKEERRTRERGTSKRSEGGTGKEDDS